MSLQKTTTSGYQIETNDIPIALKSEDRLRSILQLTICVGEKLRV